jgi:Quinohemoprotein amine dehydrogenase, alpha subunit domain III
VTNPGSLQGSCTSCLTIDAGPSITSVVPSAGVRGGSNLPVKIFGSNFANGAKVKFGSGITINSHTFVNSGEIDATISISSTAQTGGHAVTVTNKDKGVGTLANGFTVS